MDDIPIGGTGKATYSIDTALANEEVAEEGFTGPLETRLSHKNWKARKGAYEELRDLFSAGNGEAADNFGGCVPAAVKDTNASALEAGLEMAAKYFSVKQPSSAGELTAVLKNVADKGLSGRPKAASLSLEIFSLCIEDGVTPPVLSSLETVLSKTKAAKHKQSIASTLFSLVEAFGAPVFDFQQVVTLASKLVQESDEKVRKSARATVVAFYQFAGEGVIATLKAKDVKPSTIAEVQKECETAAPLPEPTRKVKGAAAAPKSSSAVQASMSAALYADAEAKPVIKFLPKNFHSVVGDPKTKWSEKNGMVQEHLMPHVTAPRLQPDDYSELAKTMKRCLSDPNVAMTALACKVLLNLCRGLRQHFSREARLMYPSLLDLLKEKKTSVSTPLQDTLFVIFEHDIVNISDVQDDLLKAAGDKVTLVRLGVASFIERCATSVATNPEKCTKLMKAASPLITKILNEDQDSGVKEAASRASCQFVSILGADGCPFLNNLAPKTRERIASGQTGAAPPATSRRPATARGAVSKSLSSSQIKKATSSVKANHSTQQAPPQQEDPAVSKSDAEAKLRELLEQISYSEADALFTGFSSKTMKERLAAASQLREGMTTVPEIALKVQFADALGLFFSTSTPGWKDASFQVVLEMLKTLLTLLGDGPGTAISQRTPKVTIASGIIEKLGDMKLKQTIKDLLTRFSECTSPRCVVGAVVTALGGIKSPKSTQEALEWLAEVLVDFAPGSTDEKAVAQLAIKCLELPTPSVKAASLKVFHSLARISGSDVVMRLLKTSDLRAALLKQVEDECAAARNGPAVVAKRTAASAPARSNDALGGPRDIKSLIDQSLLEKLSATSWADRGDALELISKMLVGGKVKSDVGPYLIPALKQRLTDTNKKIIPTACRVVGELFENMGPPARTHAGKIIPSLMQLLGDQKPCVRQGARKALASYDSACGLDGLLPYLPKAMSTDVPAARQELSELLASIFNRDAEKLPLNSLNPTVQPLVGFLQDKNPNTRKLAEEMLKPVIENVGYETVAKHIGDLGVAKQRALQPILEKNKMYARSSEPAKPPTKKIKHGHSIASEPSESGISEPTAEVSEADIRAPEGMPVHTPIYEAPPSDDYSEYRPKTMFKSMTKDARDGLPAQTPLMPARHSSSFSEPAPPAQITTLGQAIDCLAHPNSNTVITACESVEQYSQQGAVLPAKINDIMLKAMNRLSMFCTDNSTPLDVKAARRLISFMTDIYQPPLSHSCTTETLFYLIGALLDNLLTEKLHSHAAYKPPGGKGSPIVDTIHKTDMDDILRQLNSLMLKILERSCRTPTFCALIKRLDMYYKLIYNESSRYIKYVELVAKCLLKLIRFVTTENTTVDFTKLLASVHEFLTDNPPTNFKGKMELPLRTVKTLLNELVKVRGVAIRRSLEELNISENALISEFITMCLQKTQEGGANVQGASFSQLPSVQQAAPVPAATGTATRNDGSQLSQQMDVIFSRVRKTDTSRDGVRELYSLMQKNPTLDITPWLHDCSTPFQGFLQRQLASLAQAEANASNRQADQASADTMQSIRERMLKIRNKSL